MIIIRGCTQWNEILCLHCHAIIIDNSIALYLSKFDTQLSRVAAVHGYTSMPVAPDNIMTRTSLRVNIEIQFNLQGVPLTRGM